MAQSGDRGRHRRGLRWWQRGPYTSRGGVESRGEAERHAVRPERGDAPRPERTERFGWFRRSERGDRRVESGEAPDRRNGFELRDRARRPERAYRTAVTAPVVDRPVYTWRDFELDYRPAEAPPHPPDFPDLGDGRRHCGALERVLHRQWDAADGPPPPEIVRAIESLARLPDRLKEKLADGLEGIYVGPGGVPDLDDMGYLRGAPLPSGRATWDICAGAYGDRKIVVGDRPSPTPDVMMHEVGHALDDVDAPPGDWVSDSPEFKALYEQCLPHLVSGFHKQGNGLGRKEFFADAFAAIASRQRPALVDMLGGDTRTALNVMLFFNRRYGI